MFDDSSIKTDSRQPFVVLLYYKFLNFVINFINLVNLLSITNIVGHFTFAYT